MKYYHFYTHLILLFYFLHYSHYSTIIQKIVFHQIPFITEYMMPEDISEESNVALTNDELWQKIVDDF